MNLQQPPKLPNRFSIELEAIKKLTWKQRLQILTGYNPKVKVKLMVDKRTGQVWEAITLTVVDEKAPMIQNATPDATSL